MSEVDAPPPHSLEAEQATLGAIILSSAVLKTLVADEGLRPEHFYRKRHELIFAAILRLYDRHEGVDVVTVTHELERANKLSEVGGSAAVDGLAGSVPAVGNAREYGRRVVELAEWRAKKAAAHEMLVAVDREDQQRWSRAIASVERGVAAKRRDVFTPEQWADVLGDFFTSKDPVRAIPLPIPRMTDALLGGIWPGEFMVIAGYTSSGKSVWADSILDHAADLGFRGHAYLTEMGALTRGLRLISRQTGIPFRKLRQRQLKESEVKKILDVLEKLPYGLTIASAWDIEDVARDILAQKWDIAVVDLIHGFRYDDERGLDRLSKTLQRVAITSTTIDPDFPGTSVIGVAHLNRGSTPSSGKRPKPTLRDLKGGTSIEQDADFVNFVWLEDDEKGVPGSTGQMWFAKGRSGMTETVDVDLNPVRFAFQQSGL